MFSYYGFSSVHDKLCSVEKVISSVSVEFFQQLSKCLCCSIIYFNMGQRLKTC